MINITKDMNNEKDLYIYISYIYNIKILNFSILLKIF